MSKIARTIVITGGTSGIGKSCLDLFVKNGDNVIVLARTNPDNLPNFFKCDVSNISEVEKVFNFIGQKYPGIDVLINNAGFGISGAIELVPETDLRNLFDVNFFGVINCYKKALPYMNKNSSIINISSVCALFPLPFRGLYCASKSAVNMLTYSMKMECSPFNVKVSAVCPGDVKTNFTKNRIKNFQTNERYGDRIKNATSKVDGRENKRMKPEKVAKVVYKVSLQKRPKPFVIVGFKYKLLYFAMKFLPLSWLIHFTSKFFGGFKKSKQKTIENTKGGENGR